MIRKIPLSDHYYKESEIDAFLNEKSDKNHEHGSIKNNGTITDNTNTVNKVIVTDSSDVIKSINKLPADKVTHQDISGKVNTEDIENNLTSNYTNRPLSAAQGKELKRLVDLKPDSDTVYTKSQTLTTSEINQAIVDGVGNIEIFEVVQELPTTNIKGNKFYLTPNGENINKNVYDINIYVNNNWETIDSLEFDIGNYPTTSEVNTLLNGKVDKIDGKQLSKNDFTDALKSKLENDVLTEHQPLTNYIQKSQTSGLVKNDGTIDTNNYLTQHQSLTNYIQKSQTSGLVKNDGTIDTNNYLTQHQSLTDYIQKSQVPGLIRNDGTIDTNNYLTQHQSLTNYVQKSQTTGLIKNDGTIDTNEYLTEETATKSPNYGFIDSNLVLYLMYIETEISTAKAVMQSGETNQITAIVVDANGDRLENIPVEFYIDGVKVGQTTNTNSNGIATHMYSGTGAGEIEIQVKIDGVVSNPYNVFDCIFYDTGIDNTQTQYQLSSNVSRNVVTGQYTEVKCESGSYGHCFIKNDQRTFPFPLKIEVDIEALNVSESNARTFINILDEDAEGRVEIKDTGHHVITIGQDGQISATNTGTAPVITQNTITSTMRLSFFAVASGTYIRFKNLKIYPI